MTSDAAILHQALMTAFRATSSVLLFWLAIILVVAAFRVFKNGVSGMRAARLKFEKNRIFIAKNGRLG